MAFSKIEKLLRNLDTKKVSQDTDIPTSIIEETSDLFAHVILKDFNDMPVKSDFPQMQKNCKRDSSI